MRHSIITLADPAAAFNEKSCVGHIADRALEAMPHASVFIPSPDSPLDRETYRALVADIDYALVFHKAQYFELVASGAIADAFACVKPLIALRSVLTEYYFETMGDIGYMCEDLDDMKSTILNVLESKPVARYRTQQNNILENRDRFSPAEISNKLRTVIGTTFPTSKIL